MVDEEESLQMMWAKKKLQLIFGYGFCILVGNHMLTPPRGAMGGKKLFAALACSSLLLSILMVLLNREDFSPTDANLANLVKQELQQPTATAEVVSSAAAAAALEQQQTGIDPPEPLAVAAAAPNIDDQVIEPGVSLDQEIVAPADHQPAASASLIDQSAAAVSPTDQAAALAPTDQLAAVGSALDDQLGASASGSPTDQPTVVDALDQSAASSSTHQLGGTRGFSGGHMRDQSITTSTLPAAAEALIRKLRAVAIRVNGGEPVQTLSESERNDWHQKNPCISRDKLPLRYAAARKFVKHVEDASPAAWDAVFREYEILHRTCTSKVQDISLHFLEKDASRISGGCNYLVCNTVLGSGLGNHILITASCLVYAVLTQRVLLLPSTNPLANIVCEPFEGSSWKVNEGKIGFPVPSAFWLSTEQFLSAVDLFVRSQNKDAIREDPTTTTVHATDVTIRSEQRYQPDNRFFCMTEQKFLRNVTWVYLEGNQHFLPKLFVIPIFRTTLESLFPSRMVLTHVLRRCILPDNSVWQRVEQVHEMQPDQADRRLGVQIRYTGGHSQFEQLHSLWEVRIKQCALENGMLPQHGKAATRDVTRTSPSNLSTAESNPFNVQYIDDSAAASAVNDTTTTVFIASLYDSFERSLNSDYVEEPPANGEQVTVVQLTSRHEQSFYNREEDEQALVEIILLSFSDDVIVSPKSTFGSVAHAYGALQPWVIATEVIEGQEANCLKAQSVDACYHTPERYLSCPHDPEVHGRSVLELVTYIKDCVPGEHPGAIQLIAL
jgi:xyloglucan fucosyltransferase